MDVNNLVFTAVKNNNIVDVQILLNNDVNINIVDNLNRLPIIYSIINNDEDIFNMLITNMNYKELINTYDIHGLTLLHYAIKRKNINMINAIIYYGINMNNDSTNYIYHAINTNNLLIMKTIVKYTKVHPISIFYALDNIKNTRNNIILMNSFHIINLLVNSVTEPIEGIVNYTGDNIIIHFAKIICSFSIDVIKINQKILNNILYVLIRNCPKIILMKNNSTNYNGTLYPDGYNFIHILMSYSVEILNDTMVFLISLAKDNTNIKEFMNEMIVIDSLITLRKTK